MVGSHWVEQSTRLYRRYQHEIVEELNLCPWAEASFARNRVSLCILLQDQLDSSAAALETVEKADASIEVLLLVFPRVTADCASFDRFVARVREEHDGAHPRGQAHFLFVAFHPESKGDSSDAHRLVPLLRRTPDATIQVVRRSVLERTSNGVLGGTQFFDPSSLAQLQEPTRLSVREQIAEANLATIKRVGVDVVERRLADIHRDRRETYAKLRQLAEDEAPRERVQR